MACEEGYQEVVRVRANNRFNHYIHYIRVRVRVRDRDRDRDIFSLS
jgi:hypothetical protein